MLLNVLWCGSIIRTLINHVEYVQWLKLFALSIVAEFVKIKCERDECLDNFDIVLYFGRSKGGPTIVLENDEKTSKLSCM